MASFPTQTHPLPAHLLHSSRQRRTSPEQLATLRETRVMAFLSKAGSPSRREVMMASSCSVQ